MLSAIYWDASAILSALIGDSHSPDAMAWLKRDCTHLVSTLAYAETCSVLSRMRRDGTISDADMDAAVDSLSSAPWLRVTLSPGWDDISLVTRHSNLRGADSWHMAMFIALKRRRCPGLWMLTYDDKLKAAASDHMLAMQANEGPVTQ